MHQNKCRKNSKNLPCPHSTRRRFGVRSNGTSGTGIQIGRLKSRPLHGISCGKSVTGKKYLKHESQPGTGARAPEGKARAHTRARISHAPRVQHKKARWWPTQARHDKARRRRAPRDDSLDDALELELELEEELDELELDVDDDLALRHIVHRQGGITRLTARS